MDNENKIEEKKNCFEYLVKLFIEWNNEMKGMKSRLQN